MRRRAGIAAVLLALAAAGRAAGEGPPCCEPGPPGFLHRIRPAGGWCPYPGGLLHWWDPHCFPRCGGPDDYCRKKLPNVCWPPYPPYYIWGPPQACPPRCGCYPPGQGVGGVIPGCTEIPVRCPTEYATERNNRENR
jgi:hypothetical protein